MQQAWQRMHACNDNNTQASQHKLKQLPTWMMKRLGLSVMPGRAILASAAATLASLARLGYRASVQTTQTSNMAARQKGL